MYSLNSFENPFSLLSLKIWYKIVSQKNLKEAIGILRWCGFDKDFMPNKLDTRFNEWVAQGLTAML